VTVVEVLFLLLGLVAVGSALLVVTTRTMVHAALWLVVTLGAVAGIFLLLAAEFVAWVQILIYVGAVVVLLLFALMLTKAPTGWPDLDVAAGARRGRRGTGRGVLVTRWPRASRACGSTSRAPSSGPRS
jgi:NADH-quinone oxidoreductase subunit J